MFALVLRVFSPPSKGSSKSTSMTAAISRSTASAGSSSLAASLTGLVVLAVDADDGALGAVGHGDALAHVHHPIVQVELHLRVGQCAALEDELAGEEVRRRELLLLGRLVLLGEHGEDDAKLRLVLLEHLHQLPIVVQLIALGNRPTGHAVRLNVLLVVGAVLQLQSEVHLPLLSTAFALLRRLVADNDGAKEAADGVLVDAQRRLELPCQLPLEDVVLVEDGVAVLLDLLKVRLRGDGDPRAHQIARLQVLEHLAPAAVVRLAQQEEGSPSLEDVLQRPMGLLLHRLRALALPAGNDQLQGNVLLRLGPLLVQQQAAAGDDVALRLQRHHLRQDAHLVEDDALAVAQGGAVTRRRLLRIAEIQFRGRVRGHRLTTSNRAEVVLLVSGHQLQQLRLREQRPVDVDHGAQMGSGVLRQLLGGELRRQHSDHHAGVLRVEAEHLQTGICLQFGAVANAAQRGKADNFLQVDVVADALEDELRRQDKVLLVEEGHLQVGKVRVVCLTGIVNVLQTVVAADAVSVHLLLRQLRLVLPIDGEELLLLDEGNEDNGLVVVNLLVHVNLHVLGIELPQDGIGAPLDNVKFGKVADVGRVVEGVEPVPADAAVEVVEEDPLYALDVFVDDVQHLTLEVLKVQLCPVVVVLVHGELLLNVLLQRVVVVECVVLLIGGFLVVVVCRLLRQRLKFKVIQRRIVAVVAKGDGVQVLVEVLQVDGRSVEEVHVVLGQLLQVLSVALQLNGALVVEVAIESGQDLLVRVVEYLYAALVHVELGYVREKVVADEEVHQDPVVDDVL
ncbi:hypothetical protein TYRP_005123 [Tyrophagus putrescentiae]|nr:hypothetical protein TYRP_005123 [Tyrophagus putrescentiae]